MRRKAVRKPAAVITDTAAITDAQIRDLRQRLFEVGWSPRSVEGLVDCHDALGRSHRRNGARMRCAELLNTMQRSA